MKFFRTLFVAGAFALAAASSFAGTVTKDLSAVMQIRRASPTSTYQIDSIATGDKVYKAILVATLIDDRGSLKVDDYIPIERIFAVYQRDDNGVVYVVYASADFDSVNMLRLRTMSPDEANRMISAIGTQVMLSHKQLGGPAITR